MSREQSLAAIHHWFERAWNELDDGAIDDLMSENCEILGTGPMAVGREGYREFYRSVRDSFDQIRVEVADIVAEEAAVAGHARFSGLHKIEKKEVDFVFSFAAKLEGGKFVWVRNVVDFSILLTQLHWMDAAEIGKIFRSSEE